MGQVDYNGSKDESKEPAADPVSERPLPWIDVEKVIFIMCNERIGDDVGIALDYRPGLLEPRVIGGDWHSGSGGLIYRQIAPTFNGFAAMIGFM